MTMSITMIAASKERRGDIKWFSRTEKIIERKCNGGLSRDEQWKRTHMLQLRKEYNVYFRGGSLSLQRIKSEVVGFLYAWSH